MIVKSRDNHNETETMIDETKIKKNFILKKIRAIYVNKQKNKKN